MSLNISDLGRFQSLYEVYASDPEVQHSTFKQHDTHKTTKTHAILFLLDLGFVYILLGFQPSSPSIPTVRTGSMWAPAVAKTPPGRPPSVWCCGQRLPHGGSGWSCRPRIFTSPWDFTMQCLGLGWICSGQSGSVCNNLGFTTLAQMIVIWSDLVVGVGK